MGEELGHGLPPKKIHLPPVTRMKKTLSHKYELHNQTLATVTSAKCLGITIYQDLSLDVHVNNICSKANKTLGFLRKNLLIRATVLKETAYKTLIRPVLEYTCSVWDLYTKKNIDILENVQRMAARFVLRNYHSKSSVTAMLDRLGWPCLQHRTKLARLSKFNKCCMTM